MPVKPEKPVAILTNSLSPTMCETGNPMLKDTRYKKLLLTSKKMYDRYQERFPESEAHLEKFNNHLIPFENLDLRSAIEYLRNPNPASFHGFKQILIECGTSTTIPCYSESVVVNSAKQPKIDFICDGNPIDTLVLSLFVGKLTERSMTSVGKPFLNLKWLAS